ncbi:MAG: CinA family nicotinamide mononucleotide deamidase-related protein [Sphingobacteriales bacterium]|nr:MAG: CinA family nicotinamide mononucleotide deamidase-related protein [Sphingobacteriales bacterium]
MTNSVRAEVITIGDELLIGQVVDTNSSWMARELNDNGIWLKRRVAVGDNRMDITRALDEESRDSQIILITGGLGPTADDITKPVLCEYFDGKMVVSETALENVKNIFARLASGRPILERNLKQAEVPDTCTVINNLRGTAPGMWFEKNGRIYVSMPGVPHEMKGMMTDQVIPKLKGYFKMPFILHRTLVTSGIGESALAEHIQQWESSLPDHIRLAYLPNYGMVRLRMTGNSESRDELGSELDKQFDQLRSLVAEWLVIDKDQSLQQVVSDLLKTHGKTLATAESCTGGYIAHLLTAESGASVFYRGGVISYSNDVKESVLRVNHNTLLNEGAVSEETVKQMVQGGLLRLNTDYCVAVSGIMGPGGGSDEKPVGTVWVAAGSRDQVITHKFHFRFTRQRNIELTANNALNLLRKLILQEVGAG